MPGLTQSKNAFRRAKKKAQKHEGTPSEATKSDRGSVTPAPEIQPTSVPVSNGSSNINFETLGDIDLEDPIYSQFKDVLDKYRIIEEEGASKDDGKAEVYWDDEGVQDEEEEENTKQLMETREALSKKEKKRRNKMTVAELKAVVKKPELVEWTDISSNDPQLHVAIKAHRNVVPVPSHWSVKREYLSSKRGIEKPAFALPKFIQETGIAEMRDAVLEKQAEMSLKQKGRERVQGKLGKLDIDYQKLYEAFFRRQTKPELTRYGEVYYEGKEYETNLRHLRPGELSDELKEALNMPPGAPPPYLLNQQRFGPPPSYPALKIPGLNAPPPPGGSWGFQPGGYGKPPVDEQGNPIWGGDVMGTSVIPEQSRHLGEPVERQTWGELRAEGESEDEDEEEEEDEEEDEEGPETASGIETSVSGLTSIAPSDVGGTESIAGEFTLQKQRRGTETEETTAPRSAFQVLPEHNIRAQGFFGGERAYDLKAAKQDRIGEDNSRKRKAGDVDISVNPDDLARDDRLNKEELKRQYETQRKAEAQGQWGGGDLQEDLSEMIATESRKRLKKDEEKRHRR